MTRDEMIETYSAPGRHYHDLTHIEDCLAKLNRVAGLSARSDRLRRRPDRHLPFLR